MKTSKKKSKRWPWVLGVLLMLLFLASPILIHNGSQWLFSILPSRSNEEIAEDDLPPQTAFYDSKDGIWEMRGRTTYVLREMKFASESELPEYTEHIIPQGGKVRVLAAHGRWKQVEVLKDGMVVAKGYIDADRVNGRKVVDEAIAVKSEEKQVEPEAKEESASLKTRTPEEMAAQAFAIIDEAKALVEKGQIEAAIVKYAEAEKAYTEVLEVADNATNRQNYIFTLQQPGYQLLLLGDRLSKEGKFIEAAKAYRQSVEKNERLIELSGEKKWQQNVDYAKRGWGKAQMLARSERNEAAAPFDLSRFEGGRLTIAELKGKVVLIEFWAAFCPECRKSLDMLKSLQEKYGSAGFTVLLVSVDKMPEWNRSSERQVGEAEKQTYPYPTVYANTEMWLDYGACMSVPTVILIDTQGKVRKVYEEEERTPDRLGSDIEALLPNGVIKQPIAQKSDTNKPQLPDCLADAKVGEWALYQMAGGVQARHTVVKVTPEKVSVRIDRSRNGESIGSMTIHVTPSTDPTGNNPMVRQGNYPFKNKKIACHILDTTFDSGAKFRSYTTNEIPCQGILETRMNDTIVLKLLDYGGP